MELADLNASTTALAPVTLPSDDAPDSPYSQAAASTPVSVHSHPPPHSSSNSPTITPISSPSRVLPISLPAPSTILSNQASSAGPGETEGTSPNSLRNHFRSDRLLKEAGWDQEGIASVHFKCTGSELQVVAEPVWNEADNGKDLPPLPSKTTDASVIIPTTKSPSSVQVSTSFLRQRSNSAASQTDSTY